MTPRLSIAALTIENKGITASIHYRLCPEPELARTAILAALQKLPQARKLRIMEERKVIDLLPPVTANKGTAVLNLIQSYNLRAGIYLGDDLTDIDAFRAIRDASRNSHFQGFAIGIISQEMPENLVAEVDFTLNGVSDVERFLEWMTQAVAEPS
ncbi:trehalose-phosphatase [Chloroflexota bacterium]